MTIFAILMPSPQPTLAKAIEDNFPGDFLQITPTQWLVSGTGTAQEITAKLGIYDPKNPKGPSTGNAIVLASSSYFGRASTAIWDWMRAKLEAAANG